MEVHRRWHTDAAESSATSPMFLLCILITFCMSWASSMIGIVLDSPSGAVGCSFFLVSQCILKRVSIMFLSSCTFTDPARDVEDAYPPFLFTCAIVGGEGEVISRLFLSGYRHTLRPTRSGSALGLY